MSLIIKNWAGLTTALARGPSPQKSEINPLKTQQPKLYALESASLSYGGNQKYYEHLS